MYIYQARFRKGPLFFTSEYFTCNLPHIMQQINLFPEGKKNTIHCTVFLALASIKIVFCMHTSSEHHGCEQKKKKVHM